MATHSPGTQLNSYAAGYPYVMVVSNNGDPDTISEIGRLVIREIEQQGDGHPLFAGGMGLVGDAAGFEECLKSVDAKYGREARQIDWSGLPNGGGALPTSRHYPGDR